MLESSQVYLSYQIFIILSFIYLESMKMLSFALLKYTVLYFYM